MFKLKIVEVEPGLLEPDRKDGGSEAELVFKHLYPDGWCFSHELEDLKTLAALHGWTVVVR